VRGVDQVEDPFGETETVLYPQEADPPATQVVNAPDCTQARLVRYIEASCACVYAVVLEVVDGAATSEMVTWPAGADAMAFPANVVVYDVACGHGEPDNPTAEAVKVAVGATEIVTALLASDA